MNEAQDDFRAANSTRPWANCPNIVDSDHEYEMYLITEYRYGFEDGEMDWELERNRGHNMSRWRMMDNIHPDGREFMVHPEDERSMHRVWNRANEKFRGGDGQDENARIGEKAEEPWMPEGTMKIQIKYSKEIAGRILDDAANGRIMTISSPAPPDPMEVRGYDQTLEEKSACVTFLYFDKCREVTVTGDELKLQKMLDSIQEAQERNE